MADLFSKPNDFPTMNTWWSNEERNTMLDPGLSLVLINETDNTTALCAWTKETLCPNYTDDDDLLSCTSSSVLEHMVECWKKNQCSPSSSMTTTASALRALPDLLGSNKTIEQTSPELLLLYLIDLSEIILGKRVRIVRDMNATESTTKNHCVSGCPNVYVDRVLSSMVTLTRTLLANSSTPTTTTTTTTTLTTTTTTTTTTTIVIQSVWKEILSAATTTISCVVSIFLLSILSGVSSKYDALVDQCQHMLSTYSGTAAATGLLKTLSFVPPSITRTKKYVFYDLDLCLDHVSVPSTVQCTPTVRQGILDQEGLTSQEDVDYAAHVKLYLRNLVQHEHVHIVILTANSIYNANYFLQHVVQLEKKYFIKQAGEYINDNNTQPMNNSQVSVSPSTPSLPPSFSLSAPSIEILSTMDHSMEKSKLIESYFSLKSTTFLNNTKIVYVDDNPKEIMQMQASKVSQYMVIVPSFRPPKNEFGLNTTYAESKRRLNLVPGVMNQEGVLKMVGAGLNV
jgi:hypothetical protein